VNQKVRELIRTRMRQKIESIHLTYESKLNSLNKMFEMAISGETTKSGKPDLQAAKSIIAEMNKMQGHYADDKRYSTILTADINKKEEVEKLISLYHKEF
uniref:hypothetical protein n=1 Tax=Flavobacterium sp. TaxID=239 RepID=UPI003F696813